MRIGTLCPHAHAPNQSGTFLRVRLPETLHTSPSRTHTWYTPPPADACRCTFVARLYTRPMRHVRMCLLVRTSSHPTPASASTTHPKCVKFSTNMCPSLLSVLANSSLPGHTFSGCRISDGTLETSLGTCGSLHGIQCKAVGISSISDAMQPQKARRRPPWAPEGDQRWKDWGWRKAPIGGEGSWVRSRKGGCRAA